ncbi:MAG: NADH-quinone oxidoreductase subunit C [Nitrospinota bacterium]|jgi:NADH-quinone oxidoreductase subunit C|nr:NADH-quinone oxidoreductase subunit C [Nitrospinota bacterium]MDP7384437.1 NADH-quinone oxidoreductase subunit C [Nitrospinota bacterium]HJM43767.1 NADH-quinone oxidoreductase subunit C [Nitrospinota bacterium]
MPESENPEKRAADAEAGEAGPETDPPAAAMSKATVDLLRRRFGDAVLDVTHFRDETTVEVESGRVAEICRFLRDHAELRYNFLADLCGLDRLTLDVDGPRFAVVYHLQSIPFNRRLRLRARVDADPPALDSVASVWSVANWHEREAFDLVGIRFNGHPNLERILTPEGFEGHPHRKDFAVGNEPVQFTGNQEYVRQHHRTTIERYVDAHRRPAGAGHEPDAAEESADG